MAYKKENWVEVPDPSNPPAGAPSLNAEVLNKIEQGIVDNETKIAKLEETQGKLRSVDDNKLYEFKPLLTFVSGEEITGLDYCFSPNKRYVCAFKESKILSLYRTENMSLVAEVEIDVDPTYSYVRVDMDDDFIVVCWSDYSRYDSVGTYQSTKAVFRFFRYTDSEVTEYEHQLSLTGRLIGSHPSKRNAPTCLSGDKYFWFLTEDDTNSSYDRINLSRSLVRLDKDTGQITLFDPGCYSFQTSTTMAGTYTGKVGMIRYGNEVYIWSYDFYNDYRPSGDGKSTKANIFVKLIDADGGETEIFKIDNKVAGFATSDDLAYPVPSSMSIDVETQRIIISGHCFVRPVGESSSNSKTITIVYPFYGNINNPIIEQSSEGGQAENGSIVPDDRDEILGFFGANGEYIVADEAIYDVNTLNIANDAFYFSDTYQETSFTSLWKAPTKAFTGYDLGIGEHVYISLDQRILLGNKMQVGGLINQ